jgi:predicted nucleic acid-binding protein
MPSLPISRRPEKLVVDANPILSALLGGKAKRLFYEADITEFAVTDTAIEEVRRYLPKMAEKLGVSQTFLAYALDLLPLTICSPKIYRRALKSAQIQIAHRDQGDVEILALTLALKRPLWTNDKDFGSTAVQTLTTAELLAIYFPKSA